jgi:hypothetical protein
VEAYRTRDELERMSGAELKQLLKARPASAVAAHQPLLSLARGLQRCDCLMLSQSGDFTSVPERAPLACLSLLPAFPCLQKRGVATEQCVEKEELVEKAAQGSNSTAASCSICCEDYESGAPHFLFGCGTALQPACLPPKQHGVAPAAELALRLPDLGGAPGFSQRRAVHPPSCSCAGDVLRALPCGHRYHLECVDRWFLSSTDYSRPAACPMCNAPLDTTAPGCGSQARGAGRQ